VNVLADESRDKEPVGDAVLLLERQQERQVVAPERGRVDARGDARVERQPD
jgi:hypothetical protein